MTKDGRFEGLSFKPSKPKPSKPKLVTNYPVRAQFPALSMKGGGKFWQLAATTATNATWFQGTAGLVPAAQGRNARPHGARTLAAKTGPAKKILGGKNSGKKCGSAGGGKPSTLSRALLWFRGKFSPALIKFTLSSTLRDEPSGSDSNESEVEGSKRLGLKYTVLP